MDNLSEEAEGGEAEVLEARAGVFWDERVRYGIYVEALGRSYVQSSGLNGRGGPGFG